MEFLEIPMNPRNSQQFSKFLDPFLEHVFLDLWTKGTRVANVTGGDKGREDGEADEGDERNEEDEREINSQSLEDTQVGYISQKYTLDKYTLEEYTLEKYTLENF